MESKSLKELIDMVENLQAMMAENKIILNQHKKTQGVMMEHLAETNENLFNFFKIRYKIDSDKKARPGGVYTR